VLLRGSCLLCHCERSVAISSLARDCFGWLCLPRNDKAGCHCERSAAIPSLAPQIASAGLASLARTKWGVIASEARQSHRCPLRLLRLVWPASQRQNGMSLRAKRGNLMAAPGLLRPSLGSLPQLLHRGGMLQYNCTLIGVLWETGSPSRYQGSFI
jgi:hypothetical protein